MWVPFFAVSEVKPQKNMRLLCTGFVCSLDDKLAQGNLIHKEMTYTYSIEKYDSQQNNKLTSCTSGLTTPVITLLFISSNALCCSISSFSSTCWQNVNTEQKCYTVVCTEDADSRLLLRTFYSISVHPISIFWLQIPTKIYGRLSSLVTNMIELKL